MRDTINTQNRLGLSLIRSGKAGEAIGFLNDALTRAKKHLPEADPFVLNCRTHLGLAYQKTDHPEEARHQFEEVIRLGKIETNDINYRSLRFQGHLASAFLQCGHKQRAVNLYERLLQAAVQTFGNKHAYTRSFRYELAKAHLASGLFDRALPVLKDEVMFRETDYGPIHPLTLEAWSTLGKAYHKAGRLHDAVQVLNQTLLVMERERNLGVDHPLAIGPRLDLGVVYTELGNREQAVRVIKQALQISVSKLGKDHPTTRAAQNQLAKAQESSAQEQQKGPVTDKKDLALEASEHTYKKLTTTRGENHPITLAAKRQLAKTYGRLGRSDKAIVLLEQVMGRYAHHTLSCKNDLAMAYWRIGRLDKSIPLLEKSVMQAENEFGPEDLFTLGLRANLGVNYKKAGALAKAISQFETVFRHNEKAPPAIRLRLEWVRIQLAECYDAMRSYAKSEPLRRWAFEKIRKRFGATHRWTGDATEKLGENLLRQKKYRRRRHSFENC